MSPKDLEHIIQQGEGLTIEFKRARKGLPDDLFESVCAFLNRTGGHVLLGVRDNGEVVGINPTMADQLKRDFTALSNNPNKLNPPFLLDLSEVEVHGKQLLYVYVPQSSQVHRCENIVFDRGHEGDFKVHDDGHIGQIYARKRSYYTEGQIFPYLQLTDFKPGLLDRARQLIRSRSPLHPWLDLPDQELLRNAGLHRRDFQSGTEGYTMAAALLFGRDEVIQSILPHYRIDALVRIENTDRYDDRLDIRTNLIDAYDLLLQFVAKHLPDKFFLQGDQRISLRETIFREVVANLIVHREYANGAPARLIIYADRVETDNANKPHGYGPIDPHRFSPHPKNPNIARFFLHMGRVDEMGSGVRNVTRYIQHYSPGRKAEFLEEDMFRTIIPVPLSRRSKGGTKAVPAKGLGTGAAKKNKTVIKGPVEGPLKGAIEGASEGDAVNEAVNEAVNDGVNDGVIDGVNDGVKQELEKAFRIIMAKPSLNTAAITNEVDKAKSTVERYLRILRAVNLIEFRGAPKTGGYFLTDSAKAKIDRK